MKKTLTTLAVAGAALLASAPALAATRTVRVADNVFKAKTITINRGDTVVWKWVGKNPHDVRFSSFRSPLKTSGTYKRRFTKRGTFRYRCAIHSGMTGRVIVR